MLRRIPIIPNVPLRLRPAPRLPGLGQLNRDRPDRGGGAAEEGARQGGAAGQERRGGGGGGGAPGAGGGGVWKGGGGGGPTGSRPTAGTRGDMAGAPRRSN